MYRLSHFRLCRCTKFCVFGSNRHVSTTDYRDGRQGVAVRTGAAMPFLHLAAGGTLAGKRPPHKPRSDHNKTRHRRARPRSKRRRGGATPAPFCCPSPQVMEFDFDLCGGIYPKGARHKGLLCEPEGRELLPAHTLCIRCLYVKHLHTQTTGAADNALPERRVGAARPGYPCPSSLRTASA